MTSDQKRTSNRATAKRSTGPKSALAILCLTFCSGESVASKRPWDRDHGLIEKPRKWDHAHCF
jgi:hypothetical protein